MAIRKFLVAITLFLVLTGMLFAVGARETAPAGSSSGLPPEVDAWLRQHKIGPYQEAQTDYDEIYRLALQEAGPVTVYASSSRGPAALANGFYERFPGIQVDWITTGTSSGIERVITEQETGAYTADVLFVSDFPTQTSVLSAANMLFSWVPSELRGVIPEQYQQPLLAQRYEARVVFFNDHEQSGSPIESWWELTTPQWRGRVVMEDPRVSGSTLDLMTTFVINADEMAAEYQRVFGRPIQLTTPNAGYEFIKLLAGNNPVLIARDSDGRFLAEPQPNPPIGVSFAFSRIRDAGDPALGNLSWNVATGLKPRIGMLYPSGANIPYRSPNPNSAKLVISWLLGDEQGGLGMQPFNVPGNWPSRVDVVDVPEHPFQPGKAWAVADLNFWMMDPARMFAIQDQVLEFVHANFR